MSIAERIRVWRVARLYRQIFRLKLKAIDADIAGRSERAHSLSVRAIKLAERGRRLSEARK